VLPVGFKGRNYIIGLNGDFLAYTGMYFDDVGRHRLLSPVLGNRALQQLNSPEEFKMTSCNNGTTPLQMATASDFKTYLADDILVKVDRASMLASLEVRAPWLDYRIIDFAFGSVPDELRTTHNEMKILPRYLAKRLLPQAFHLNRKQGFSLPLNKWFKGEWGLYIEDILNNIDDRLFSRNFIKSLITSQRRGLSNTKRLFALAIFELWRKEYRISVS
jgi:asparagine synthase (glutamine-hydrolysing)